MNLSKHKSFSKNFLFMFEMSDVNSLRALHSIVQRTRKNFIHCISLCENLKQSKANNHFHTIVLLCVEKKVPLFSLQTTARWLNTHANTWNSRMLFDKHSFIVSMLLSIQFKTHAHTHTKQNALIHYNVVAAARIHNENSTAYPQIEQIYRIGTTLFHK